MPSELYLGVDAGGTRTRAAVVDETGAILGEGESGPGNLMSADVAAVRNITEAVRQALGGVPPDAVTAACIAAAGLLSLPEGAEQPDGLEESDEPMPPDSASYSSPGSSYADQSPGPLYTSPRPYSPQRQPVFVRNTSSPNNPQSTAAPAPTGDGQTGLIGPVGYDAE
jgi:hypothetical protein